MFTVIVIWSVAAKGWMPTKLPEIRPAAKNSEAVNVESADPSQW